MSITSKVSSFDTVSRPRNFSKKYQWYFFCCCSSLTLIAVSLPSSKQPRRRKVFRTNELITRAVHYFAENSHCKLRLFLWKYVSLSPSWIICEVGWHEMWHNRSLLNDKPWIFTFRSCVSCQSKTNLFLQERSHSPASNKTQISPKLKLFQQK